MTFWWLMLALVVFSFLLTGALRRYALSRSIIDIPNERSSHTTPTPRGGGVAIVLSFLLVVPYMTWADDSSCALGGAILGAGGTVALLGFADDHGHIAARWRLLGHFAAAVWALYWLGGLPPLELFGFSLSLGLLGHALAAVYLVWLLNLYNFMDGIDGIASVEAVCVCMGGALLYALPGFASSTQPAVWIMPMLLAAAVVGFLMWNFPPAKIFMGDAGSGFLGILLGIFSLQAAVIEPAFFWSWLILLGVFIVDATLTLIRRLMRGAKVYQAHRSHAYQHAALKVGRHLPVTVSIVLINICWLLPLALLVGLGQLDGGLGLVIAYLPLILLALHYRAGVESIPIVAQGGKS